MGDVICGQKPQRVKHTNPDGSVVDVVVEGKHHIGFDVTMGDKVFLEEEAVVGDAAEIGSESRVGRRSVVGPSCIIGINTNIYTDVRIHESVVVGRDVSIMDDVVVGDRSRICDDVYLGVGVVVGSRSRIGTNISVGSQSKIGEYSFLGYGVRIGNRCVLPPTTVLIDKVQIRENLKVGKVSCLHLEHGPSSYAVCLMPQCGYISIGCQCLPYTTWSGLSDEDLALMDGDEAVEYRKKYGSLITSTYEHLVRLYREES